MGLFSSFSDLSGWYRLLIVASTIWVLSIAIVYEPWRRTYVIGEFLLLGILPVIVLWGFLWIIRGFKKKE